MKKLIFVFALLIVFSSFADENVSEKNSNEIEFKCDVVNVDTDNNILNLCGNASFKTDIIDLKYADKIVFNQTTKEIIATNVGEFNFNGSIQIIDQAEYKTMRYTIGERIAYLE